MKKKGITMIKRNKRKKNRKKERERREKRVWQRRKSEDKG